MESLRHPLVLVHGLGGVALYDLPFRPAGTPFRIEYFHDLAPILMERGIRHHAASLPAWGTIAERAQALTEAVLGAIENDFPGEKVNLLTHSRGAIDARHAITHLGLGEHVASLTSIGSPHRGSALADILLGRIPRSAWMGAHLAFDRLVNRLTSVPHPVHLDEMSRDFMQSRFNPETPDSPDVRYFWASSAIRKPITKNALPAFWVTHPLLERHEGPNDGFVSLESAAWGEHLATFSGDHYAQIGQPAGWTRGMDHRAFYRTILDGLQDRGL